MTKFFNKKYQAIADELEGLYRITSAKRTATLRLAFGRALHEAFTVLIARYGGEYTTVGLEWIEGRERVVADVLGNASAFFESLAHTVSAPAVVNQPELFEMIDPKKRQQFVLLALSKHSPLQKVDIQQTLQRLGLTDPQIQQFMLQIFEQYSGEAAHPIWMALSRHFRSQLEWGALWQHLSADEMRRILLVVARVQPNLIITQETKRTCSLLAFRLTPDVIDEIVEVAISNTKMNRFSALWSAEMGYAPAMLSSMSYKKHLAGAWSAEGICWLASASPQEIDLSVYDSVQLFDGLEYVCRQMAVYRKRQFDYWPLFRMQRWCLEALFTQGYVEAPLAIESVEHGGVEYVAYYEGERYTAFNSCSKMPAGTPVLFKPQKGDSVLFRFVVEM